MYSTDDNGNIEKGSPGHSRLNADVRLRMASALRDREMELCDRWTDALLASHGGIYENVSRPNVLASTQRLFGAYVELLRTEDPTLLKATVLESSRRRFSAGCPLVALLQTLGAARVTMLPALNEAFAEEPEILAEAVAALMAGEETTAIWIAQAYEMAAEVESHEKAQPERDTAPLGNDIGTIVSNARLVLCDQQDIPPRADATVLPIINPRDVRFARNMAREQAESLRWPVSRTYELQMCVGEAGANALRYAGTAVFQTWTEDDSVSFRMADTGPGIDFERLPVALSPGYSTDSTLGMGFTLMLELADRIHLATNSSGTVLQLTLAKRQ